MRMELNILSIRLETMLYEYSLANLICLTAATMTMTMMAIRRVALLTIALYR